MAMTLADAQRDMRRAFVGGGPGAMVSGIVWLVAAVVLHRAGVPAGFAALFLGGLLIFPIGLLVVRVLRRPAPQAGNPLGRIGLESTLAMLVGLFAAWLLLPHAPALVIPVAAMAVGAHYFVFSTLYGDTTYWALAGATALVGVAGVYGVLGAVPVALGMAAIELAVGARLTARSWRA